MQLILISAMTRDRVIGSRNGLPWSLPSEYRHFLDRVRGQMIMMGRTSFEIFGPDLRDSELIVISRSSMRLEGATVFDSVESAIDHARAAAKGRDLFCGGGASIYRQTLPLADALYLSFVRGAYDGDAYFPEFDESDWQADERKDFPEFEFVVYRRRSRQR